MNTSMLATLLTSPKLKPTALRLLGEFWGNWCEDVPLLGASNQILNFQYWGQYVFS